MYRLGILLFSLGLFCSCSDVNSKSENLEITSVESHEDSLIVDVETSNSDCIFDLSTQTDDFLNGIQAFKDYEWNNKEKIALVQLPNDEYLSIVHGGCDHYTYEVELVSKTDTVNFKDSEYWISRLFEFTNLLPDFENELIKSLTIELGEPETETDEFIFWPFPIEQYCSVELVIRKNQESTSISISYYLC